MLAVPRRGHLWDAALPSRFSVPIARPAWQMEAWLQKTVAVAVLSLPYESFSSSLISGTHWDNVLGETLRTLFPFIRLCVSVPSALSSWRKTGLGDGQWLPGQWLGLVTLLSQQRLGRPPGASISADSIGSGRIHWATCATGTTPLLKPTGHRSTGARSGGLPGAGVAPPAPGARPLAAGRARPVGRGG